MLVNGAIGNLNINWITPTKIREFYAIGQLGMFKVDYLTQDLFFYENANVNGSDWDSIKVLRGVSEGRVIRFFIDKKEPLRSEQEAFLSAIRNNTSVAVTGEDGLRSLELAQAMVISGNEHRILSF